MVPKLRHGALVSALAVSLFLVAIRAQEPAAVPVPAAAPLMALVDFDFAAVHEWWAAELDLGRGIVDLIANGLIDDGTYRVLERRFLPSVLAEQNLAAGPRNSDQSALAPGGKLLGAEYMIMGSVTNFGLEKRWGGLIGFLTRGAAGVRQKGKAMVSVTARIVDVNTGEVVASVKADGISTRTGLVLGGVGPGGFVGFGMGSSEFRDTVLGEATEAAIKQVVERLVAQKPRLARR